jgi:hypothetical protein
MDSQLSEKMDKASYRIHNHRINLRYVAKPKGPGSGKRSAPSAVDRSQSTSQTTAVDQQ